MGGQAMNDEFIYRQMPEPRAEFTEELWDRIAGKEKSSNVSTLRRLPFSIFGMGWKLAVPGIALLAIAVLSIPSVRAAALQAITSIAGFDFEETAVYPYEGPIQYNEVHLDIEEAREELPFSFGLPTWIPEGYVPRKQALVLLSAEETDLSEATNIYLYWLDRSGNNLILIAQALEVADCPACLTPVGADSTVEVFINGFPAALTRGAWNIETEAWDTSQGMINLRWISDDALYMMTAIESSISEGDLIRVAESIP